MADGARCAGPAGCVGAALRCHVRHLEPPHLGYLRDGRGVAGLQRLEPAHRSHPLQLQLGWRHAAHLLVDRQGLDRCVHRSGRALRPAHPARLLPDAARGCPGSGRRSRPGRHRRHRGRHLRPGDEERADQLAARPQRVCHGRPRLRHVGPDGRTRRDPRARRIRWRHGRPGHRASGLDRRVGQGAAAHPGPVRRRGLRAQDGRGCAGLPEEEGPARRRGRELERVEGPLRRELREDG